MRFKTDLQRDAQGWSVIATNQIATNRMDARATACA